MNKEFENIDLALPHITVGDYLYLGKCKDAVRGLCKKIIAINGDQIEVKDYNQQYTYHVTSGSPVAVVKRSEYMKLGLWTRMEKDNE